MDRRNETRAVTLAVTGSAIADTAKYAYTSLKKLLQQL